MKDKSSAAVKIPCGYRKLSRGEKIVTSDFVLDAEDHGSDGYKVFWLLTKNVDFCWYVKKHVVAIRANNTKEATKPAHSKPLPGNKVAQIKQQIMICDLCMKKEYCDKLLNMCCFEPEIG